MRLIQTFIQCFKRNNQSAYANRVYKFKSVNYFQPVSINNIVKLLNHKKHNIIKIAMLPQQALLKKLNWNKLELNWLRLCWPT